jgi:ComF family protein
MLQNYNQKEYFSGKVMTVINDFLSLIYPPHCEACERNLFRHENYLCNHCRLNLPKSNYHRQKQSPLSMTFYGRVPLLYACSFYLYEKSGKVQKMLHAIKYQEQKELAQFIGKLYAEDLKKEPDLETVDMIMPIPLHKNKLKARGFNQSEWFAKGLSEGMGRTLENKRLQRIVDTKTQTKKKKYQRWENVEGIFELKEPEALYGKHVLLVDDVITTGATIEAAWQALKEVKDIKLSVASIAFAAKG